MFSRKPRPLNRWRHKDAARAYNIGYFGQGDESRHAAALFDIPFPSYGPMLWWVSEYFNELLDTSWEIRCGVRFSTDAEVDARAWAQLSAKHPLAICNLDRFEHLLGSRGLGLIAESLQAVEEPLRAEALDLFDDDEGVFWSHPVELQGTDWHWPSDAKLKSEYDSGD